MRIRTTSESTKSATCRAGTPYVVSAMKSSCAWVCSSAAGSSRRATVAEWKDASDKEWQARRMAVYAAMVDRLDQNIGRILTKLREIGQEDNTLVMFMSDNGGCAEEIARGWTGLHIPRETRDGLHTVDLEILG